MKWVEYIRGEICWQVIRVLVKGLQDYTGELLGIPADDIMFLSKESTIWWRSDARELNKIGNLIIEKTKDAEYKKKHSESFYKYAGNVNLVTKKIRELDLSRLKDNELAKIHKELVETFYPFSGMTFYSIDAMDLKLEELILKKLKQLIREKLKDEYKESVLAVEYSILTTPDELSFVNKEELMINKLAEKKLPGEELRKEAQKIVDLFWWVPLAWQRLNPRTVEDILAKISEIKDPKENIERIKNHVKTAKSAKKEMAEKYSFDDEMNHLLSLFEEYAVLHDYRKEGQMKTAFFLYRINDEIGKRKNIDAELLDYSYPGEIQRLLLEGNIDIEELKDRKKAVYYHYKSGKEEFYSGEKAMGLIDKELKTADEVIENFSGLTASLGKAIGKAKICHGVNDAKRKLQQGDILVTGMTTPDFVPYMKKAAAIVTEEGGATSHAAIISRELGIPCIVGTKIAMKVLNDNDLVEVDADNNIVRLLK